VNCCLSGTLPTGATFDPVTQTFSWTPGNTQTGSYKALFTVTDSNTPPASDSEEITITVGTNTGPSVFSVNQLSISQRLKTLFLLSNFTLGKDSNGINPVQDAVTLTIANYTITIPAGSFRKRPAGVFAFAGKINNVSIEGLITLLGSNRFLFQVAAYSANLGGMKNPVKVGLAIGDDSGTTSVNAVIK